MKRHFKSFAWLILLLAAAVAASGQTAWYPVVEKDSPTVVDVVLSDEEPHSVIVQILNSTPWEIQFNSSPQAYTIPNTSTAVAHLKDVVNTTDRHANKSFMFAPVGVPNKIPGIPPGGNTVSAHPYSFVLSWDDYGGLVQYSSVFWKIKQVQYCFDDCNQIADVPLGLYMSRISPPKKPISDYLKAVIDMVKIIESTVKIALGDWKAAFELAADFKDEATELAFLESQKQTNDGVKMYVSAFPPPDLNSDCYTTPADVQCYPSAKDADGATDAEWGNGFGGPAAAEIVVLTHVRRGISPTLGSLPVIMITVMRWQDYWDMQVNDSASAVALQPPEMEGWVSKLRPEVRAIFDQLRRLLNKHGLAGADALKVALDALNFEQRKALSLTMRDVWSGKDLKPAQQQFLRSLVVNLRLMLNEKEEG